MTSNVLRLEGKPTDSALVLASCDGDRAAKEALFRRHLSLALGLAVRLLGRDDDDVDDIVQESFATAFAKLGALRDPQAFASWLASIVTATAVAVLRRRRIWRRLGLGREAPGSYGEVMSKDAPPHVIIELRAVYDVIQQMPVDDGVMLVLRRVEELTHEEIAERTGWSVATIKRRLIQAEKRLEMRAFKKEAP